MELFKQTLTIKDNRINDIPSDDKIDDRLVELFDNQLLPKISKEFANLTIEVICQRYKPILDEFYELSSSYRASKPKYNNYMEKFISEICSLYKIERTTMLVYPHRYTTTDWGRIYWLFLHYSSILVTYAFENGKIVDYLNFALLVYNIDAILPCGMCIAHYQAIKETQPVRNVIKQISFGSAILGLLAFHNIITDNVNKSQEYKNRPHRHMFSNGNFAQFYECIESDNEQMQKSATYKLSYIDWQPKTHNLLSVVYMSFCPQSYARASNNIKRQIYHKNPHFANINLNIDKQGVVMYSVQDQFLHYMSGKQIKWCIARGLLLQFSSVATIPAHAQLLFDTIKNFYENNTEFMQALIQLNASVENSSHLENVKKIILEIKKL